MRIELKLNNCHLETQCALCASFFSTGDITAIAFDSRGELVGNICDDCLKLSAEQLKKLIASEAEKLREEASTLLAQAEAYQALSEEVMILPREDEWAKLKELTQV